MTTLTEATSPTNDGSPSWVKQRSSIFINSTSSATNTKPAPKVVDKELARLKNVGAVSSIWSNKFVQEDSNISGGNNYRPSVVSPPPTSPNGSSRSSRSLSGASSKRNTIDEKSAPTTNDGQTEVKSNSNFGYFSKNSMSSLDLNEASTAAAVSKNNRSSVTSSVTSSVPNSPTKQTSTDGEQASKAVDPEPTRSHSNSVSSNHSVTIDDAASLWFQLETLKTQYAQSNARLTRANEDIEFYKRQLDQTGEVSRQGIAIANEEKDKELLRVRQLAQLIAKQDKLLGEYELNLDVLTRLTNESAYLDETQAEMDGLRQELATLNKQKEQLEGAIAALKAELEMSYSQMRLMMVVSTEIQNEFDSYKEKVDLDIKEMMRNKQVQHEAELKALQEKLVAAPTIETTENDDVAEKIFAAATQATATAAATAAALAAEHEKALSALVDRVTVLTEALEEKDKAVSMALLEKDKAIKEKDQALVDALAARDKVISQALEEKEKAVHELEYQLKTQKMSMDAKLMMLNQTILEKDNLLMEFMSSRNNSREVISAAASMSSPVDSISESSAIPAAAVTNTFYHHQGTSNHEEARIHITQARDYMFSSTDDESSEDDEDEAEVVRLSYSSDEEEVEQHNHNQQQQHQQSFNRFHPHLNENLHSGAPQSPAETVSSANSFDSDDEEEKVAEIKHFSYSSVQSQTTRPLSLISTTESLTAGMELSINQNIDKMSDAVATAIPPAEENNKTGGLSRNNSSTTASPNVAKETNAANWPMPPPTPPPSEPLPPVPVPRMPEEEEVNIVKENVTTSAITTIVNAIPAPPRRARSKTMARDEIPDMSVYTTSVHQTNELPRIVDTVATTPTTTPVAPPRKDLPTNISIVAQASKPHTKWMDDPESSEDEEVWSEANTSTPTKQQKSQEWSVL